MLSVGLDSLWNVEWCVERWLDSLWNVQWCVERWVRLGGMCGVLSVVWNVE